MAGDEEMCLIGLPGVMDRIGQRFLFVRLELHTKLDFLRVELREGVRMLADLPVHPAKQVLDDAHFNGLLFPVAKNDFERFVRPVV